MGTHNRCRLSLEVAQQAGVWLWGRVGKVVHPSQGPLEGRDLPQVKSRDRYPYPDRILSGFSRWCLETDKTCILVWPVLFDPQHICYLKIFTVTLISLVYIYTCKKMTLVLKCEKKKDI